MAANGRHRRYQPSRLNRASLTVTAGGAGIALPLVAATSAGAAPTDVWEKVAACESTSNWHINSGNGYFGGLQFTRSTWAAYGGTVYTPRADLATRDQQITVAEKVLEGQGPGAWPGCSTRAGLTSGGDAPDVNTQSARTSRVKTPGKAAAGKPETKRTATPATPTTVHGKRESYTVASGDSLSAIAATERVRGGWQHLYATNRKVVGDDPDLIFPGQRLSLDAARASRTDAKAGSTASKPTRKPKATAAPHEKAKPQQRTAEPKQQAATSSHPTAKPQHPTAKPQHPTAKPQHEAAKPQHPTAKPHHRIAKPKTHPKKTESHKQERAEKHAGLVAPVAAGIGTPYHQTGSWASGYHTGVDFPVPTGTSVKAVDSGTVVSAGWGGAYGYQIVIRHSDGKYSQYAHLSALHVREGRHVSAGQRIARSGSTGNVTGPHLHFEIRTGPGYGSDVDPLAYLRAGGVSV
ncbi:transglycosylase family protein [Streptomyces sp. NBC_01221]|uniref:transglycosylase family protein n=1 Tax=unclassified Streptomyces TaxID=2593676 RepID=UPI00225337E0|nr:MULTISPECIES: transglycosylase family protein [unclassified Streptomyces]MCX4791022.1 transglycosylase family protein [Streptomyces sp. NBC_01221]WSJ34694.1 transglycosylase family protein [Streptomyces sp. NBC_01321]WSP59271.1 transglycosylase family protein [Streptomyces sp. NBC_01241]